MRTLANGLRRVTGWIVAGLLMWMILIAVAQLVMRWLFLGNVPWIDLQLRQMVLWVACLGGVLAAADNRHIRIDLVDHYLPTHLKRLFKQGINALSAVFSLFLALLSVRFIRDEAAGGLQLNGILFGYTIPQWLPELVIPVGFLAMALFFAINVFYRPTEALIEPANQPSVLLP